MQTLPTKKFAFPKSQRLASKKLIAQLFQQGQSNFKYPFKLLYLVEEPLSSQAPQVLISVPKRNMRKASDRNLIKRRIREAYRTQKHHLQNTQGKYPLRYLVIIYVAKEKIPFVTLEEKLVKIFKRLR